MHDLTIPLSLAFGLSLLDRAVQKRALYRDALAVAFHFYLVTYVHVHSCKLLLTLVLVVVLEGMSQYNATRVMLPIDLAW